MRRFLTTLLIISLIIPAVSAQIYYEIEFNTDVEEYVLSVHSDDAWEKPYNRTSTAQITIKSPSGTFFPDEVISLIPNVLWEHNSSYYAPEESSDYDYFSFGLSSLGTDEIKYEKGAKIPIISFKNKYDCSDLVNLVDNESDAFMYPNKSGANIGNHITVLGSFKANSYSGNINETTIPCSKIEKEDHKYLLKEHFSVFPNPTKTITNLSSDWPFENTDATATLLDLGGKSIISKDIQLIEGSNQFEFDLTHLSAGIYYIKISSPNWDIIIDEVAKIE